MNKMRDESLNMPSRDGVESKTLLYPRGRSKGANSNLDLCIVYQTKTKSNVPYIRQHVELLPFRISTLSNTLIPWQPDLQFDNAFGLGRSTPIFEDPEHFCLPQLKNDIDPLLSNVLIRRMFRYVKRRAVVQPIYNDLKNAVKIFLKKNRVKAVLAEHGPVGISMSPICQELNIPLIIHFHGADAFCKPFFRYYRSLFKPSFRMVVGSRFMHDHFKKLGFSEKMICYNPCGADTNLFSGGNPEKASKTFISVSRMVSKKAPHLTLLAFKKVIDRFPDAKLIFIGDGPLKEACFQLSSALGISHAVEFLGTCSSLEISKALKQSRAFVLHPIQTSHGCSEGTCIAAVEAIATGIPVIATRHSGLSDIVEEGKTGLLVDERDIDGMAKHMIRVAEDPHYAAQLGSEARKRAITEFSLEKSIKGLETIIRSTLR